MKGEVIVNVKAYTEMVRELATLKVEYDSEVKECKALKQANEGLVAKLDELKTELEDAKNEVDLYERLWLDAVKEERRARVEG